MKAAAVIDEIDRMLEQIKQSHQKSFAISIFFGNSIFEGSVE
ncbi:MAG: hypothetical protein U0892_05045 [Pirellulales bacterium]